MYSTIGKRIIIPILTHVIQKVNFTSLFQKKGSKIA